MGAEPFNRVLEHLRTTLGTSHTAGLTDSDLLKRYVCQRDEAAFEALLRRHGPMVFGVCRRLLHNHHDAEDAFQATFLLLVRKASTLRSPGTLSNWLYGVAYRTALEARRAASKRRRKEAMVAPQLGTPAETWVHLQEVLDQELTRLPAKYRAVIVLCDLQAATGKAAARYLGVPEGTVASRLARGRALLARRLSRHGLAMTSATLAAFLGFSASVDVPAALASLTIKGLGLWGLGKVATAGAISAPAAALAKGVLKTMLLTKLKTVTVVVVLLGLLGAGVGAGLSHGQPGTAESSGAQLPGQAKRAELVSAGLKAVGQPTGDDLANLQRRLGGLEKQIQALTKELEVLRQNLQAAAAAPTGKVRIFSLQKLSAFEVANTLKELFATRLAAKTLSIASPQESNSILVQGSPKDLDNIEAVISRLEVLPVKKGVDPYKKGY
jgi:RNA polymerase sigma factor (sigma-70 family)